MSAANNPCNLSGCQWRRLWAVAGAVRVRSGGAVDSVRPRACWGSERASSMPAAARRSAIASESGNAWEGVKATTTACGIDSSGGRVRASVSHSNVGVAFRLRASGADAIFGARIPGPMRAEHRKSLLEQSKWPWPGVSRR